MHDIIDYNFIYNELKEKYCLDNGAMAYNPIQLFKLLMLKGKYKLSDRDLIERGETDMAIKYFLDISPVDSMPHHTLLTKFRKLRLNDENLLKRLIAKTVEVANNLGITTSKTIIVDSTHTKSVYNPKTPIEILTEESKILRKDVYEIKSEYKDKMPIKPSSNDLDNHIEYCKNLIALLRGDNTFTQELIEQSVENGYEVDTMIGDGAGFTFNKDAGMYACTAGHMEIKKVRNGGKKNPEKAQQTTFFFDVNKCKVYPLKNGCYNDGSKTKTFTFRKPSKLHQDQVDSQNSEEFKNLYKERYKIEAKNSELKNSYGMAKTHFGGLFGMQLQSIMSIFTINLKRIITINEEKKSK